MVAEGKKQAAVLEGQGKSISFGMQINAGKKEGLNANQSATMVISYKKWESVSGNDKIIVENDGRVSDGAKFGAGSNFGRKQTGGN